MIFSAPEISLRRFRSEKPTHTRLTKEKLSVTGSATILKTSSTWSGAKYKKSLTTNKLRSRNQLQHEVFNTKSYVPFQKRNWLCTRYRKMNSSHTQAETLFRYSLWATVVFSQQLTHKDESKYMPPKNEALTKSNKLAHHMYKKRRNLNATWQYCSKCFTITPKHMKQNDPTNAWQLSWRKYSPRKAWI